MRERRTNKHATESLEFHATLRLDLSHLLPCYSIRVGIDSVIRPANSLDASGNTTVSFCYDFRLGILKISVCSAWHG